MKKLSTLFVALFGIFGISKAQQFVEPCGFNHVKQYFEEKHPGYKAAEEATYRNRISQVQFSKAPASEDSILTIPVVFHVVWNTNNPEQNLHDSVLYDQLRILNEDYQRTNPDTVNLRAEFNDVVGSAKVRFVLANIDPNGDPKIGIVRKETTTMFGGGLFPDMAAISKIQKDAEGGSDAWNPAKYVNIWIGDINGGGTPSLLGVATPPPGLPNWPADATPEELTDGVCLQFQTVGSNNPNPLDLGQGPITVNGRTATHEVGHYTGLRHTGENTFGGLLGDVCVSTNNNSDADDGLIDTPDCDQSQQDCDTQRNSCVDDINGVDLPDMIENYMDYSDAACQNSFTNGQSGITRSVIQNERDTLLMLDGYELTGDVDTSYTIDAGEFLGDLNGNGVLDEGEVVGDWSGDGLISGDELDGDVNGDGVVDASDIAPPTSTVGIESNDFTYLKVFPNPTKGNLVIENGVEISRVEILNSLGQTVETISNVNTQVARVNLTAKGLYFVNIYSKNAVTKRKIVVQ